MTVDQLALAEPGEDPPPAVEHAGRPVVWSPWAPAGRCAACAGDVAVARGVVRLRRREVPPRGVSGFAFAVCPEVYEVPAVSAWRCGCGVRVG